MSGRPKNPDYAIPVWAPDVNYGASADPWSVTPTKIDHPGRASVGFTPRSGVAAQCVNILHNQAFATDGVAKAALDSWATYGGQIPALNFSAGVTAAGISRIKYCPAKRAWMGVGDTDVFKRASGEPYTWPTTSEITGGNLTTLQLWDFDVDTAGNIVAICNGVDTILSCTAAGVWTKVTGQLGDDTAQPCVVFDPVSGKWVAAFNNQSTDVFTPNSTNRVTWGNNSTDIGLTPSSIVTMGTNGLGRIVIQGFNGTNVQFTYSDNAGVTWSTPQTLALGFTYTYTSGERLPKPVFNGTEWLAVVPDLGSNSCKFFRSPDGATWTQVASFTHTLGARHLAAIGELWVMTSTGFGSISAFAPTLVYSVDRGVTWRAADFTWFTAPGSIGAEGVASNGSRFLVVNPTGDKVYVGVAAADGSPPIPYA